MFSPSPAEGAKSPETRFLLDKGFISYQSCVTGVNYDADILQPVMFGGENQSISQSINNMKYFSSNHKQ